MPHIIQLEATLPLIRKEQTVFIQGGSGEPSSILKALRNADTMTKSTGTHYVGVFPPGINRWDPTSFGTGDKMTAFFATPELRNSLKSGTARLLPSHYSSIYNFLRHNIRIDVAIIQVAPPNDKGECSLGISVDFVTAILENSAIVIAEINDSMPSPTGSPTIPFSKIDYAIEVNHPLVGPIDVAENSDSDALSRNVASLIEDGDCIQIGVGKYPAKILNSLRDKNDLGFHSGLLSESVLFLLKNGNMTGANKPIDKNIALTGIAYGAQHFYEELAQRDDIRYRPVTYTHCSDTIRRLENFVAINSAIEVDLFGQVNAEFVNGQQVSGVGGLVDFMRGARLAKNGRGIIAFPAKAGSKGMSRIVPQVNVATCSRSDVDFVVTEFGIANLRNKSAQERAEAMISIAAPEHRGTLSAASKRLL